MVYEYFNKVTAVFAYWITQVGLSATVQGKQMLLLE